MDSVPHIVNNNMFNQEKQVKIIMSFFFWCKHIFDYAPTCCCLYDRHTFGGNWIEFYLLKLSRDTCTDNVMTKMQCKIDVFFHFFLMQQKKRHKTCCLQFALNGSFYQNSRLHKQNMKITCKYLIINKS